MSVVSVARTHADLSVANGLDHLKQHRHYQTIARAIDWLDENQNQQPGLAALSNAIGMSEYHLQRVFSEWAGISPKQFIQFLTLRQARTQLRHESVLNAALDCGFSGSGRLHDLTVNLAGATPGEIKSGGNGLSIEYGTVLTPFGWCFLATTDRGICKLGFIESEEDAQQQLDELVDEWPAAERSENQSRVSSLARAIFESQPEAGLRHEEFSEALPLRLFVKGSAFQIRVWEALLQIPSGHLVSYAQVAEAISKPSATRAVASAIARNSIGWLIPCHRVIRQTGALGQYRWSPTRKQAMIAYEGLKVS